MANLTNEARASQALTSPTRPAREPRTQEDRILWVLHAAYPSWTPAPVLSRISLQYNARVHGLRRKGWEIANRVEVRNGKKHGFFRLATPGTFPNPKRGRRSETIAAPDAVDRATSESRLFSTNTDQRWVDPEEGGRL